MGIQNTGLLEALFLSLDLQWKVSSAVQQPLQDSTTEVKSQNDTSLATHL